MVAGVSDPEKTRRVIVDIPINGPVRIFTSYLADEKIFDVAFSSGDFGVVSVGDAED